MAADVLSINGTNPLDIHKSNAYSGGDAKFDLTPPSRRQMSTSGESDHNGSQEGIRINPELSTDDNPTKEWEIDVKGLMSTRKWLQNYGLKRNRLDMHQILPQIGFKHADDYDKIAKKPICSRYGNNLFQRYLRADGKTYNISCTKDALRQLEARLTQAVCLYRRRLDWLTSESRRTCGVVEEKSAALVVDINNLSPQGFEQYRAALDRMVREQFSNTAKFNLIRACEDLTSFRPHCVPVTGESIDEALAWVRDLDRTAAVSPTATCEAVLKACSDRQIEAIYLFTEGSACDGARELLKEKLTGSSVPVHVISFNCTKADTVSFLKDMCRITGGRFHAYAVTMELDTYEGLPVDKDTNQANILLKKQTYGGVPPGAGIREDVLMLFEELEEARNNLAQIQGLIQDMADRGGSGDKDPSSPGDASTNETYMSSREWLERHGLKARRLGFYDILAGVAFKHQDGVVDLKKAPADDEYQTDAITKQKLVNARYCDKFPHVRWKDGQVVHVQVTPEIHRNYEQRMLLTMEAMQQRIDWLQQGSRELFGTVIEDQIYILVDTSASMAPHIQFVKDKLFVLMQEQLRHKQKFNLVTFNSRAHSWKDRLVEVTEKNLQGAWQWIKNLVCLGSTNTMAALRHALSDPSTQAIYLLTDGRPDQPPKSILSQVMLHPQVPIHTISFNCADRDANEFLCQLAKDTGGRYHYYSENGIEPEGPEPWESEDIRMLKQEMASGYRNLEKVAMLRDECAQLAWRKPDKPRRCSRDAQLLTERGRDSGQPPLDSALIYRSELERPNSAPSYHFNPTPPYKGVTPRPTTAHGNRQIVRSSGGVPVSARSQRSRSNPARPISARSYSPLTAATTDMMQSKRNVAAHTRTSLLRSLSSMGNFNNRPPWLLPETRELLDKQWARQSRIIDNDGSSSKSGKKKRKGKKSKKNQENGHKMSSRKWLSIHGLEAKKLALVDALAPTFIPHKAKYVPIIDKHVNSKVFDDLLPIGHKTGDKLSIVNPQAIKLDDYIEKVEKAVDKYTERLDNMVWDALSKESKEEFDSNKPVAFLDNRLRLLQLLDQSGWPLSETDILLLEAEIKQGQTYISQARDLKDAARNHGRGLDEMSPADDDVVGGENEEKEHEGMGEALKDKTFNKEKTNKMTKNRMKRTLDVLRGQKVIGRSDVDGFYYQGYVIKCPDSRHALVEYDDIGQQTVPTRFVIPVSGAIAQPPIREDDYVLAKVMNQDTGLECYVPGCVHVTPKRARDQAKFYTVKMYTTQQSHFLRSFLVKISKMRYQFLVRYIQEMKTNRENQRTRSRSRSSSGSRSRSSSRSSRSYSRSRSRSRSSSRSSSESRSRSRTSSRSSSRSSRSDKSKDSRKSESNMTEVEKKKRTLMKWQKNLERQQREQDKKQNKLRKKTLKLAKLKRKLAKSKKGGSDTKDEHKKLLKIILDELSENKKQSISSPSSGSRTKEWVNSQNKHDKGELMSIGGKGALIFDQKDLPPLLLEMRQSLPELREGEEVLARWSDDGWYYRGTIKECLGDGAYLVEDSVETLEKIWREDVIADNDDADVVIQPKDAVIAQHPSYAYSYAPGVVMETTSDLRCTVRFYDDEEGELPREEVYRVPAEKFEVDNQYIIAREQQWVGAPAVARNDETGMFQLGIIQERIGNGRQYRLAWSEDGDASSVQVASCIFGAFTKSHTVHVGDRVLAMALPQSLVYLPGWVTARNGNKLAVKFCDGSFSNQIDPRQSCFWLSQEYYDTFVAFYKSKAPSED